MTMINYYHYIKIKLISQLNLMIFTNNILNLILLLLLFKILYDIQNSYKRNILTEKYTDDTTVRIDERIYKMLSSNITEPMIDSITTTTPDTANISLLDIIKKSDKLEQIKQFNYNKGEKRQQINYKLQDNDITESMLNKNIKNTFNVIDNIDYYNKFGKIV